MFFEKHIFFEILIPFKRYLDNFFPLRFCVTIAYSWLARGGKSSVFRYFATFKSYKNHIYRPFSFIDLKFWPHLARILIKICLSFYISKLKMKLWGKFCIFFKNLRITSNYRPQISCTFFTVAIVFLQFFNEYVFLHNCNTFPTMSLDYSYLQYRRRDATLFDATFFTFFAFFWQVPEYTCVYRSPCCRMHIYNNIDNFEVVHFGHFLTNFDDLRSKIFIDSRGRKSRDFASRHTGPRWGPWVKWTRAPRFFSILNRFRQSLQKSMTFFDIGLGVQRARVYAKFQMGPRNGPSKEQNVKCCFLRIFLRRTCTVVSIEIRV